MSTTAFIREFARLQHKCARCATLLKRSLNNRARQPRGGKGFRWREGRGRGKGGRRNGEGKGGEGIGRTGGRREERKAGREGEVDGDETEIDQ